MLLFLLLTACPGADESGGALPTMKGWESFECDKSGVTELPFAEPRPIVVWERNGGSDYPDWEMVAAPDVSFIGANANDSEDRFKVRADAPCVIFVAK
jgi:hypothetical protein